MILLWIALAFATPRNDEKAIDCHDSANAESRNEVMERIPLFAFSKK